MSIFVDMISRILFPCYYVLRSQRAPAEKSFKRTTAGKKLGEEYDVIALIVAESGIA
jgi:hypothetical protein